jgi:hypothetical protein
MRREVQGLRLELGYQRRLAGSYLQRESGAGFGVEVGRD